MPDAVEANKQPYFERVVEIWILLQKILLPVPVLIYIGYKASRGTPDISVAIINGLIGVACVSLLLFPVAMALKPLDKFERRRIDRWVEQQDVLKLLAFVNSAVTYSDWEKGCAAIVRVGPIAVPTVIWALDPIAHVFARPGAKAGASSSNLRAGAAHTLGLLKDSRAVVPLIQALGDKDAITRKWVCDSLGLLGDPQAIAALQPFAERDPDGEVRKAAAEAVDKLRGVSAAVSAKAS